MGDRPVITKRLRAYRGVGLPIETMGFHWVKLNSSATRPDSYFTGLGYWTRANLEQCLLAARGKPKRKAKDVRRLIVEPHREHSCEPDQVRERIERLIDGIH